MSQLLYRDAEKAVYVNDDGSLDRVEWGAIQSDGTVRSNPAYERLAAALSDLKLIADSSGALTAAQLSNAVRLLAKAVLRLALIRLGRLDLEQGDPPP